MKKIEAIKVNKTVKPLHFSKRTPVELVVGNDYFVSFGNNEARKCTLTRAFMQGDMQMVEIKTVIDQMTGNGLSNEDKYNVSMHVLNSCEIGLTPEEAVINEVTM